ncbi:snare associated Golgi protein-domain-containing protein [Rhexocercosporidium sp. MPI-PUGE-AT-0058]|nr:snare associated Golgi protein-domain-containing protein [Rhexocercosporidium sp. MPI-PUGE-AT-0058]
MELSILQKDDTKLNVEEMEYEYRDFKWKDPFTKAKYIPWWIIGIVVTLGVAYITIKHDKIVETLRPLSVKIKDIPGGFLIPVVILIIISFPPLFGHEIVGILVGAVWGLWIGFAIVAAGTFIGEIGTWYAFKYAFRRKAVKLEKTNLNYGALARLTRDSGFWIILLIRFSIIPSHLSTAVFSTCDVKFWHFAVATFLTLPKQIIIVYFGVLLTQEKKKDNLVNGIVLGFTFLITVVAGVYIYLKMRKLKAVLIAEQTARLEEKRRAQQPEPTFI